MSTSENKSHTNLLQDKDNQIKQLQNAQKLANNILKQYKSNDFIKGFCNTMVKNIETDLDAKKKQNTEFQQKLKDLSANFEDQKQLKEALTLEFNKWKRENEEKKKEVEAQYNAELTKLQDLLNEKQQTAEKNAALVKTLQEELDKKIELIRTNPTVASQIIVADNNYKQEQVIDQIDETKLQPPVAQGLKQVFVQTTERNNELIGKTADQNVILQGLQKELKMLQDQRELFANDTELLQTYETLLSELTQQIATLEKAISTTSETIVEAAKFIVESEKKQIVIDNPQEKQEKQETQETQETQESTEVTEKKNQELSSNSD